MACWSEICPGQLGSHRGRLCNSKGEREASESVTGKNSERSQHMSESSVVRESESSLWGTATRTCEIAWWTQGRTGLSMIFTHLFIPQAFVVYHA